MLNNGSIKTALEFHKTIFCSQNCQGTKSFAIIRQGNKSWPAVQTVCSASAGLECPAPLCSRFLEPAPEFVTAVSSPAKQALQQLAVLGAVVTQPLPWMILL